MLTNATGEYLTLMANLETGQDEPEPHKRKGLTSCRLLLANAYADALQIAKAGHPGADRLLVSIMEAYTLAKELDRDA